ncbi:hypothetical protein CLOM_g8749 [Closterium sp. NIES-68]|nr:hypothetical protein CLOM_g8749 [Closterium sp. NIES-68]GJP64778.1 hypothetical protein CLOP_g21725 [Closterium sp. NIES-67]
MSAQNAQVLPHERAGECFPARMTQLRVRILACLGVGLVCLLVHLLSSSRQLELRQQRLEEWTQQQQRRRQERYAEWREWRRQKRGEPGGEEKRSATGGSKEEKEARQNPEGVGNGNGGEEEGSGVEGTSERAQDGEKVEGEDGGIRGGEEGGQEEKKEQGRTEQEGRQEGQQEGQQEGRQEGQQKGRLEGQQEGRLEGRQEGQQEGRLEGRQEGQQEGRLEGQQEGRQEASIGGGEGGTGEREAGGADSGRENAGGENLGEEGGGGGGGGEGGRGAEAAAGGGGTGGDGTAGAGAGAGGGEWWVPEGVSAVRDAYNRGERFYLLSSDADNCVGQSHFTASLACTAAEARALNRTLVLASERCLSGKHTMTGAVKRRHLGLYYNYSHILSHQPVISITAFLHRFKSWDHMDISYHGVGEGHSTQQLQQQRGVFLIIRQPQEGRYAFEICDKRHNESPVTPDRSILIPTSPLLAVIHAIVESMGGDYHYVHVRRGDKLDPRKWPHLDRDTRPEALIQKLPSLAPLGCHLYIATNEREAGFFHALKQLYRLHLLGDYAELWARGSVWAGEMRALRRELEVEGWGGGGGGAGGGGEEEDVEFDSEMQVIVDYELAKAARKAIYTFNDLTDDPKDGYPVGDEGRQQQQQYQNE